MHFARRNISFLKYHVLFPFSFAPDAENLHTKKSDNAPVNPKLPPLNEINNEIYFPLIIVLDQSDTTLELIAQIFFVSRNKLTEKVYST